MSCKSILLPVLLKRVLRIKSITYIHLIPAFSLKGEGTGTCVDTYANVVGRKAWPTLPGFTGF